MPRRVEDKEYLQLRDNSVVEKSALEFFNVGRTRDAHVTVARLADQFERQNRSRMSTLNVAAQTQFDGSDLRFRLSSSSTIGAVPLLSPSRGTPDFGLLVEPRFSWNG